jgi:hypothetical protein
MRGRLNSNGARPYRIWPSAHHTSRMSVAVSAARKAISDPCGVVIQVCSGPIQPPDLQPEPVVRGTGENVHVKMEDRLIGHLAIGEKHVHSLTRQLGAPQCPRQQMDDLKQVRRQSLVDVLQARGVRLTDFLGLLSAAG